MANLVNPESGGDGDMPSFDRVVGEVLEPVRRFLARRTDAHTAGDVLGETLVVLWRRRTDIPVDAAVPWTIGIARRQLQNAERSARRQDRLVARIAAVDPPKESVPGPGDDDGAERVTAALLGLRPPDAEILRLWAWDELSIPAIATVLGISANAVSIRLHRAKGRLRERLGKREAGAGHVPAATLGSQTERKGAQR